MFIFLARTAGRVSSVLDPRTSNAGSKATGWRPTILSLRLPAYAYHQSRIEILNCDRTEASMRSALILTLVFFTMQSLAQDAKPDKLPKIIVASPLAVVPGESVKLDLRGLLLDELMSVKVGASEIPAEVTSKGKSAVPQNYDPKRIGDTQAELKFMLPADTGIGRLSLAPLGPGGQGTAYDIAVLKAEDRIEEKEPNDGFKSAQPISVGKTVVGTIHAARNVDVFEIKGQAGQKLTISVTASQAGSPLDPFVTLYDGAGRVIAGNDDADGRDSRLDIVLKSTGSYFVSLQDASDGGGPHFAYLLKLSP